MMLRRTLFDTAAISSVNVIRMLAQFLAVPLLARILSPTDYGVVAMAMPFVLFAMIFTDAGIGMSLVRTPASERGTWSTCFWLSLSLGGFFAVIMAMSAPWAAWIFAAPQLEPVVLALSLVVFIQSLGAVSGAALQQQHRFRHIAAIEIATTIIGIGTAVIIALAGGGAWALVGQQLAFYTARVILTVTCAPFRPLPQFDWHSVKEHCAFGRDVLVVNLIAFFTRSLDNLIIGNALASAATGIYSMAFQFVRLPFMLVTGPLQYVLYAKLAKVKDNEPAVRATFLVLTRLLAIIVFPTMGMVAAAYQPIFNGLLSAKWAASGKLFMLAAPASALQAVTALTGTVLLVLGHAGIRLRMTIEAGALWLVALLLSVRHGLDCVAVSYSMTAVLYAPRSLMLSLPLIGCATSLYWRTLITPVLVTCLCLFTYLLLRQTFSEAAIFQLGIALALGIIGIMASVLLQFRLLMSELASLEALSHSRSEQQQPRDARPLTEPVHSR
jgi:PST family polysaccharide transporter